MNMKINQVKIVLQNHCNHLQLEWQWQWQVQNNLLNNIKFSEFAMN